jgi:hypothetical protein
MPAPKTERTSAFRVALNPRNPEATSWFNSKAGVNLFLGPQIDAKSKPIPDTGPISRDLSKLSNEELADVVTAIHYGILIVAEGDFPEGVKPEQITTYGSGRSRWTPDLEKEQVAALKHFDELLKSKA